MDQDRRPDPRQGPPSSNFKYDPLGEILGTHTRCREPHQDGVPFGTQDSHIAPSNNDTAPRAEFRVSDVRRDPPDIKKITTVLIQLMRQQTADNPDDLAAIGDTSSPRATPTSEPSQRRTHRLDPDQ